METSAMIRLRQAIGEMQRALSREGSRRTIFVRPAPDYAGIIAVQTPAQGQAPTPRTVVQSPTTARVDTGATIATLNYIQAVQAERARRRGGTNGS